MKHARKYEIGMVALLCVSFGVVSSEMAGINYLMPFLKSSLQLTNMQVGLLISGFGVTYALSGSLTGPLVDKLGKRKTALLATMLLFSVSSVLSGFAGSFATLLMARLYMGAVEGPIFPIVQSVIALESPNERRGMNMGIVQTLGTGLLGIMTPPLLVGLALRFGWRAGFFVVAIPGLIAAILASRFLREPAARATDLPEVAVSTPVGAARLKRLFRFRNVWLCAAGSCFMFGNITIGSAFFPLFLLKVRHLAPEQMSFLMSVPGISCMTLGITLPMLSDRLGRKPVMYIAGTLGMLCPLAAIYWSGTIAVLGVFMYFGWALAGASTLFVATVPSESVPTNLIPGAIGLMSAISMLVGGVAAPVIAGWSADAWGLAAPLVLQAGCGAAAAMISVALRETAPKARRGMHPISHAG